MLLARGAGIHHPIIRQQQNLKVTSIYLLTLKLNRYGLINCLDCVKVGNACIGVTKTIFRSINSLG